MRRLSARHGIPRVALHPEGVDRNTAEFITHTVSQLVALHPEGVDRNKRRTPKRCRASVALHPEGVDSNTPMIGKEVEVYGRPPPGGRG